MSSSRDKLNALMNLCDVWFTDDFAKWQQLKANKFKCPYCNAWHGTNNHEAECPVIQYKEIKELG